MLQAMEEESVLATERQVAVEKAAQELGRGAEAELRQSLESNLRSEIEAELRAASAKQTAELRGRLEKELRDEIGQQMRVEQVESERGLRQRLAIELRPEIEKELRPRIEEKLRSEIEGDLQPRIEEKLRPEIEKELRPRLEEKLRFEIETQLRAHIEEKLRPEIEQELRTTQPRPAQSDPEKSETSAPAAEGTPQTIPERPKELSKPIVNRMAAGPGSTTPAPLPELPVAVARNSQARSTSVSVGKPRTAEVAKSSKPADSGAPMAGTQKSLPGFPTPSPSSPGSGPAKANAVVSTPSKTPAPLSASPTPTPLSKTPPLAFTKPVVPMAKTPSPVSAKPDVPLSSKGTGPTPVIDRLAVTPGPVTDPRERAERRARVIVSDLSLYHKDLLTKAAQATDPKKELGTLWRDAVLAYDRSVSPEVRNNTHYLEDELDRYLAQLRQSQTAAAGQ
jgi:hypothetical protein